MGIWPDLADEVNWGHMVSCPPIRVPAPLCFPAASLFGASSISRNQMASTAVAAASAHARTCVNAPKSLFPSLPPSPSHCTVSLPLLRAFREAPCNGGVHAERFIGTADLLARSFLRSLGRARAVERQLTCKEGKESETGSFLQPSPRLPPSLSLSSGIGKPL